MGIALKISDDFVVKSAAKLSTKNAWALYVRRRWPQNTVKAVMAEWGLTEGQARGVVFAQASQSTIDDILDHPRGGFALGLLILEIRLQTHLRAWVETETERLAHEAEIRAAESAALAEMAARLPAALGMGAPGDGCVAHRRHGERGQISRSKHPSDHQHPGR